MGQWGGGGGGRLASCKFRISDYCSYINLSRLRKQLATILMINWLSHELLQNFRCCYNDI